jgi:NitT/TauT family transport system substrate-binding protein
MKNIRLTAFALATIMYANLSCIFSGIGTGYADAAPVPYIYTGKIAIPNYGADITSMPWAIALKKGFFDEEGIDITGIIGSGGGSSDVRNLIGGNLIYAESAVIPVLRAIQTGLKLEMISENSQTLSDFIWITRNNSSINSLKDLKGKRISFTTPLSDSELMDKALVQKAKLNNDQVQLIATGAFGAALTALQTGGVDVAIITEPVYSLNKGTFRTLVGAWSVFPAMANVVGVTSVENEKKYPNVLRGILAAHQKAVQFMDANPEESAQIIAPIYHMPVALVESIMKELRQHRSTDGIPFYSEGDFNDNGMTRLISMAYSTGILKENINWRLYVDQEFLPKELQSNLN